MLVDSPQAQRDDRSWLAKHRDAELRPILPGWVTSRQELRDTVRWALG